MNLPNVGDIYEFEYLDYKGNTSVMQEVVVSVDQYFIIYKFTDNPEDVKRSKLMRMYTRIWNKRPTGRRFVRNTQDPDYLSMSGCKQWEERY